MKSDLVNEKTRVSCIGTGVMGGPVAAHILRAGFPLTIHNRTPHKAKGLLDSGASWASCIKEASLSSSIIITMPGNQEDVRNLYFGDHGLIASANAGSILINLTSSDPKLAEEIHAAARQNDIHALDAPVSGGQKGAIEGRLCILVGGEESAYHRAETVLRSFGTPRFMGKPGNGQIAKLANQIAMASTIIGVCESLSFLQKNNLDATKVLECMNHGMASSWALQNLGPRMLNGDTLSGMDIGHFIMDLKIARAHAQNSGLHCPGLDTALSRYEELTCMVGDEMGSQALFKLYAAQGQQN